MAPSKVEPPTGRELIGSAVGWFAVYAQTVGSWPATIVQLGSGLRTASRLSAPAGSAAIPRGPTEFPPAVFHGIPALRVAAITIVRNVTE
jgi:hypothetical protein